MIRLSAFGTRKTALNIHIKVSSTPSQWSLSHEKGKKEIKKKKRNKPLIIREISSSRKNCNLYMEILGKHIYYHNSELLPELFFYAIFSLSPPPPSLPPLKNRCNHPFVRIFYHAKWELNCMLAFITHLRKKRGRKKKNYKYQRINCHHSFTQNDLCD